QIPRMVEVRHPVIDHHEVEVGKSEPYYLLAPYLHCCLDVRKKVHFVDHQERPAVDLDVARVAEELCSLADKRKIIFPRVLLSNDHFLVASIPPLAPVFVRPQNKEWSLHIGTDVILEWLVEQFLAVKMIVVEAKTVDPVFLSQIELRAQDVGRTQIVKAQFARDARLVVTAEEGLRLDYIVPLGEAWPMCPVVLWN